MNVIYHALWVALSPLLPLVWALRARRGKEDRARRAERFGHASQSRPAGKVVWLHAASVGESLSLLVLIDELRKLQPAWNFIMTTGTVTSAVLMAKRLPQGAVHQYVPFDHPAYVKRFLDHWRPDGVVWCESEIWPGMLAAVATRRIPAVLLNARMGARSANRWQRWGAWARQLFGAFDFIAAQTPADAARFRSLTSVNVAELGNLKFVSAPLAIDAQTVDMLTPLLAGRTVWAMISTHATEEALAADLHWVLKQEIPNLLTIIVPRHPARVPEFLPTLAARGSVTQRSAGALPIGDIYVWDTFNELGSVFALVKNIAMGGSFAPIGGHNPIEPAQHGCAVIVGPHMENFVAIMDAFDAQKAVQHVANANELAAALRAAWHNPAEAAARGERARAVCAAQAETLPRLMNALTPWQKDVNTHA